MIAIIDYGMGNLRSVQKAMEKNGADAHITQDPELIARADKLVLPGVGAMLPAMEKLQDLGLTDVIRKFIETGKPFLGICLGLQLLFEKSSEGGENVGLNLFRGTVERFNQLKVPHMGWNQLQIKSKNCPLWKGVEDGANVYFCHSYYANPADTTTIASTTPYGPDFTSAIWKGNVFAVQFHPEKSQDVGLKILENFIKL